MRRRETDVHVGQSDDTESLVDLPKVDLVSGDTSVLESAGDGIRRGGGELDGGLFSITVSFSSKEPRVSHFGQLRRCRRQKENTEKKKKKGGDEEKSNRGSWRGA